MGPRPERRSLDGLTLGDNSLRAPEPRRLDNEVEAIFDEEELPEQYREYVELNARLATSWPIISVPKEPLPDHEAWREREGKRGELSEQPAPREE